MDNFFIDEMSTAKKKSMRPSKDITPNDLDTATVDPQTGVITINGLEIPPEKTVTFFIKSGELSVKNTFNQGKPGFVLSALRKYYYKKRSSLPNHNMSDGYDADDENESDIDN